VAATAPTLASGVSAAGRTTPQLSPEQRVAYERDGYVVVDDVFSADELEKIDWEIDRLVTVPGNEATNAGRGGWIYDVARKSAITRDFAEDPRLLSLVEGVVYPGLAIHSSKLVTKLPRSHEICHWHQDEAYYRKDEEPATHSTRRMSVWVPLQDATLENGCLWVVPGTHAWGIDEWVWQDTGTCQKRITRHEYAEQHAIPLPVKAGAVVLFTAWTWHHSKHNRTDRVRRAFIVSYQEATVGTGHAREWRTLRPAT
jgi:ectoine hydroxylase-related dioxygenase (phytanoyl-CoA dioxygenase family)